jgi:SulP family sulfate permease
LVAGPLVGKVPLAGVAAVLIGVALRMGDWHEVRRLGKMPLSDAVVLLTTLGLTVVFDLVIAVQVGMVLAAMLFIKRVSETTEIARVHANDELIRPENIILGKQIPDGVIIYRIFGPFLFGAAEKMEDALSRIDALPRVLIIEMHLVTAMDLTGMNALESIVERMKQTGGVVVLSGIHHQPLSMLRKAGFIDVIGRPNFCATLDDSLDRGRDIISGQA